MLNGSFAQAVRNIQQEALKKQEILDIISFAESKSGLAIKLYPAQRFILKIFYSLPLNPRLPEGQEIVIKDDFNEHIIDTFTSEIEFFKYLHQQKRINLSYDDYLANIENNFNLTEIIFVCGRRASKTTMTSIIVCYTLYILLTIQDPHDYFGVLRTDPIGVALVAHNARGSERTYRAVSDLIKTSKFFDRYYGGQANGEFWLKTESFREEEERGVQHTNYGNIQITSYTAGPSVRGASNIIVVLDEFAHFRDSESDKEKYLDETVYEALHPSILGFVEPETGKGVGKSFIMSSPNGKKGMLYDMYKSSFDDKTTLMLNVPSNWINNRLAPEEFKRDFKRSEQAFRQEYRAEFIDKVSNWISDINRLYACFDHNNPNECIETNLYPKYCGFDLGLSNDRTVFAVGHYQQSRPDDFILDKPEYDNLLSKDDNGFYIIDFIRIWEPTAGGDVMIDAVIEELDYIFQRFNIKDGSYDQFSASIFTQLLNKKPRIKMECLPASQNFNSDKALLTKRLINEGRLLMPDVDIVRREFQALREEVRANGIVRVANDVGHDDTFSAISTCLYHIYTNKIDNISTFSISNINSAPVRVANRARKVRTSNTTRADRLQRFGV